jgi:hypothetical protein
MTRKLHSGKIPGISIWPITYRPLHASGASVTDLYLTTLQDDGNLSEAAGKLEHLLQLCAIRFHIYVLCLISIGRPGLVCKRSAPLAVNDDLLRHEVSSLIMHPTKLKGLVHRPV